MPEAETGEDRSLPATERRRSQSREEGRVPKSTEVNTAVVLLTVTLVYTWYGTAFFNKLGVMIQQHIERIEFPQLTQGDLQAFFLHAAAQCLWITWPVVAGLMLAGLLANVSQVGLLWSPSGLAFKGDRINPISGFTRIFSLQGLMELLKSSFKIAVLLWIGYWTISEFLPDMLLLRLAGPEKILPFLGAVVFKLLVRVLIFLVVLALIDYAFQRWEFEKSIRMTMTEMRQELKETMGDPQIKSRVRGIQREMARQRMMQEVPTAEVVITNPTHFAIALKYNADMIAPQVAAKGKNLTAQRIKQIAIEHNVPLYEDRWLARELYETTQLGDYVPEQLWDAVAKVLAYIRSLDGQLVQAEG